MLKLTICFAVVASTSSLFGGIEGEWSGQIVQTIEDTFGSSTSVSRSVSVLETPSGERLVLDQPEKALLKAASLCGPVRIQECETGIRSDRQSYLPWPPARQPVSPRGCRALPCCSSNTRQLRFAPIFQSKTSTTCCLAQTCRWTDFCARRHLARRRRRALFSAHSRLPSRGIACYRPRFVQRSGS